MADISKALKIITLDLYEKLSSRISDKIKNIELTPGPKGDAGPQGPAGATGAKGNTGDRGPQGYPFKPEVDSSGNLSWTNNGGLSNPSTVNIKGPQGEKGAAGERGPQGPKGDNGYDGSPGRNGIDGLDAGFGTVTAKMGNALTGTPTVSVSTSGSATAKNFEFTFSNLKGATGAQGATGPQGPTGPKGEKGDIGPQGPAGSNATVTVDSSLNASSSNPVQNKAINAALKDKAPKNHASMESIYGLGTDMYYGHVSLTDDIEASKECDTESGIASTPKSVYDYVRNNVRRTATKVVGTTKSGHTVSDCDYLCDGTADQVEINNAINALPAGGGKVVLLEGTYNISASIRITKSNVVIAGMGNSTILKRMFNDRSDSLFYDDGVINLNTQNGVYFSGVENLRIDGNRSNYTSNTNAAVKTYGCKFCTISGVTVENEHRGIQMTGSTEYSHVENNSISNVTDAGIYFYLTKHSNISNNHIINAGTGIKLEYYSEQNKVADNYIAHESAYADNEYSIYITNGTNNDVSDNYIWGKNYVNNGGTTNTFNNNRYQ